MKKKIKVICENCGIKYVAKGSHVLMCNSCLNISLAENGSVRVQSVNGLPMFIKKERD
jgi:hypothetical protein